MKFNESIAEIQRMRNPQFNVSGKRAMQAFSKLDLGLHGKLNR